MAARRKIGTRDMVITMALVLVVVGLIALYGGGVIFAPGGSPVKGTVPTANVIGGFTQAQNLDFPVTVPRGVPASWHPNSFTVSTPQVDGAGTLPTVRGGWVTSDGAFITLIESSGDPDQVLAAEIGQGGSTERTVMAGGAVWTVTTGRRAEAAWIRTTGKTTFLITGNASEPDFQTLAQVVGSAG